VRNRFTLLTLAMALLVSAAAVAQEGLEGAELLPPVTRWLVGDTLPYDAGASPWPEKSQAALKVGKQIYEFRCAPCHGLKGDGAGDRARELTVKPRDFTFAVFKFRSTPTGALPTDRDLYKTISRGLHGTAMVPWIGLTTSQRWLVVYYLKTFSDFFDGDEPPQTVAPPKPSRTPDEYVKLGRQAYDKGKCWECHGKDGYGDGDKATQLKDDWGRPIRPTNFRQTILKRGLEIGEIYLTIATGLNGTPMPSYSTAMSAEEMLALAYYVRSMAPDRLADLDYLDNYVLPDENAGLTIDHMQGVRFPGPEEYLGR